jgi:ubiquinone/menaquinone biosynthesis C-methylase UbiE
MLLNKNITKKQKYYGYVCINIILNTIKLTLLFISIIGLYILSLPIYLIIIFFILFIFYFIHKIFHGKKFSKTHEIITEKMIELSGMLGNEKILDLGTGSGLIALNFSKKIDDGLVIGVDKWENKYLDLFIKPLLTTNLMTGCSLKNAMNNQILEDHNKKCQFIKLDYKSNLPFLDNTFDIITSSQSVYLIKEKKQQLKLFKEINRVLKKRGRIVFYEPKNPFYIKHWNIFLLKNFFKKLGFDVNLYDIDDLLGWKYQACILIGIKK